VNLFKGEKATSVKPPIEQSLKERGGASTEDLFVERKRSKERKHFIEKATASIKTDDTLRGNFFRERRHGRSTLETPKGKKYMGGKKGVASKRLASRGADFQNQKTKEGGRKKDDAPAKKEKGSRKKIPCIGEEERAKVSQS